MISLNACKNIAQNIFKIARLLKLAFTDTKVFNEKPLPPSFPL